MPNEIQKVEIPVAGASPMNLHFAAPASGKPGPGIMVFQEAFGVNGHIRNLCQRFAREGYFAVAPELFHRTAQNFEGNYTDFGTVKPHMAAVTAATLEADARATFEWLKTQDKVQHDKIACTGYCLGGRASWVANAALPLQAAVIFYGGGIAPDLLPMAERQHGPLLNCWGGLDKHITSDKTRAIADALTQAKKTYVHVEFSDADHAFFCEERQNYNAKVSAEAWALKLAFLKARL